MKKDVKEGYKKYEFGLIPNDWEVKKIGDIFEDLKCGATPSRAKIEYYNGNIPWITSGELKYKTIYKTFENITENAVKDTNLTIYPKGTFFIAITGLEADGTRGSCAISGIEATTNQSCLAFRPKIGFCNQYLYQWYRFYGDYIGLKYTQGTKQQSLNNKIVGNLEIPVPKLKEQEKIAEILSTVDEQIENTEKLIKKNQEFKKGLMQQLLTKGIGHTEFKKTELGDIPKEWEIKNLDEISILIDGDRSNKYPGEKDIVENGILFLSTQNIVNSKINYDNCKFISQEKFNELSKGKLKKDDLVITLRGSIGNVAKFNGDVYNTGFINAQIMIIRSKNINSNYLSNYLISDCSQKQIIKISSGSAQPQLTKRELKKIKVIIPSEKEQKKISVILSILDKKLEEYKNKKEKLELLKKGLMQQLLNGNLRVKYSY
ncbi:restriction endonuclease subunit S [Clostridium perfringens]|uniref:restriction endonuclease subunit S n=1 Tax=Clostridium perfringens TaxID=1502 RepID=UPI001106FBAD|nr:restriction endonuclease subunit S [Clostridium perfringens]MDZ5044074.1 hypothetical protein [Clostridium perfringens]